MSGWDPTQLHGLQHEIKIQNHKRICPNLTRNIVTEMYFERADMDGETILRGVKKLCWRMT